MAKHDGMITVASIWGNMERRFSYLYTEEHDNGQWEHFPKRGSIGMVIILRFLTRYLRT